MELISWSEKYSVNNNLIDSQHKKLVGLINQLHAAMKESKGKEILQKILGELILYTKDHFSTEERMMSAAKFPGFAEHKKEHDGLTAKVLDLQKKYGEGSSSLTIDIMNFLKSWLINHIEGTDKKYKGRIN
ncbi:MAG TPA: bacteriohemerythrin [Ignavibacteriaceae bacterium]|nr:bacteriohemerythrin [Ignavibacteriaceae bacterium]